MLRRCRRSMKMQGEVEGGWGKVQVLSKCSCVVLGVCCGGVLKTTIRKQGEGDGDGELELVLTRKLGEGVLGGLLKPSGGRMIVLR